MNKDMNTKSKETFMKALKGVRKHLGYSQDKMAEELNLSTREYGDLERGKHGLSAGTMMAFFELLADETILNVLHACREDSDEQK